MKNSHVKHKYTMLALIVLLLTVFGSTFSVPASAQDQISGAIWTTNAAGSQVNGNLFSNPRDVYLMGGPQKPGGQGLANGWYRFQVTDTSGKALLSSDNAGKRQFQVEDGAIVKVINHNFKNVTGKGLIIQLWPFEYTSKTVGEYKVWVTTEDSFQTDLKNGGSGFVSSLSKTDNFKTGRSTNELLKYFELNVTTGISDLATALDWEFSVNYTIGVLGSWTSVRLLWDRTENGLEVYQYETTFANGATIYWQFSLTGDVNWDSVVKGPETISENGMVNSEICPLFVVSGHKYEGTPINYVPSSGSRINLSDVSSDAQLDSTFTNLTGYYQFVAEASETGTDFNVSTSGSAGSELWHDFTATLPPADRTFDFYDYDIANLQGLNSPIPTGGEPYPTFEVVFTPSNNDTFPYKLSSTNPGAFHFDVEVFRETIGKEAGGASLVEMSIQLPDDGANDVWDTPNFFVKHSTPNNGVDPVWDIHIYAKNGDTITGDITSDFTRTVTSNGKDVSVNGTIPSDADSVLVSLHLDYQISGSLTIEQVAAFQDFTYEFTTIIGDPFGVRGLFGVR